MIRLITQGRCTRSTLPSCVDTQLAGGRLEACRPQRLLICPLWPMRCAVGVGSVVRRSTSGEKTVWIETLHQDVLTAGLESGATHFLFQKHQSSIAADWQGLGKFEAIFVDKRGVLTDGDSKQVGRILKIESRADVEKAEAFASEGGSIVMDASDWQIIPAENLVAAFQGKKASLLGVARSSEDARVLLQALELGTDGVVLRTESAAEVKIMMQFVKEAERQSGIRLALSSATVTRIQQVGLGDRVAVDMCSLLVPGEGLLVGSFSRGLFLVHSECNESRYINSRPFRVNCGPVHAYVAMPNGKTAYLSELAAGSEVLVVDALGWQATAIVGRVKIETRPLVLVEAEVDGERFSTLLQNAETVRLVCPNQGVHGDRESKATSNPTQPWTSVAVTELKEGIVVLLQRLDAARHAGVAIKEKIVEK